MPVASEASHDAVRVRGVSGVDLEAGFNGDATRSARGGTDNVDLRGASEVSRDAVGWEVLGLVPHQ